MTETERRPTFEEILARITDSQPPFDIVPDVKNPIVCAYCRLLMELGDGGEITYSICKPCVVKLEGGFK